MNGVYVVIPAFNEEKKIGQVVQDVLQHGYSNIIVVDDGSEDATGTVAKTAGAIAITHRLNRGKGAATRTGIVAASQFGANVVVTIDGDGQHFPSDIPSLIEPIMRGECDVVLGYRPFVQSSMPWHKITHNVIANGVTAMYAGIRVKDSQSGLRAYSNRACQLLDTKSDSYEYESEIIHLIAVHKLSFQEVPISVAYTEYSKNKIHKQNISNGIKTVYKMIFNRLS
ncbi:MAG TPA: glycosyltransferase family 2 protein [Candidatus Andersenbacteria bacterium]|nr:glycosyltransferase family 2 protein [Candidatus Andersenbacteria bacterium]